MGGRCLSRWVVQILVTVSFLEGSAERYDEEGVNRKTNLQEVAFTSFMLYYRCINVNQVNICPVVGQ